MQVGVSDVKSSVLSYPWC